MADDREERWRALDQEMPVGGSAGMAPEERNSRWQALDAAMPPPGAEPTKPPQGFVEGTPQWQAPGTAPDTSGILTGEPAPALPGLSAGDPAGAPGRIAAAAADAASSGGPIGMTPQTRAGLLAAGIYGPGPLQQANEAVINPLVSAADLAAAGFRGLQGGVAQTGAELGQPQLGRDIAALPEAFPLGPRQMIGPAPPPAPAVNPVTAAIADRFTAGQAAEQATVNRLIGDSSRLPGAPPSFIPPETPRPVAPAPGPAPRPEAPSFVPPGTPTPAPATAEPPPNSVGAMGTPDALAAIPERDALIARYTAEKQRLDERQPLGHEDPRVLVPGVNPTEAQVVQQVATSREEKRLAGMSAEARQMADELEEQHNAARVDYYKDNATSPSNLEYLKQQRRARAEANTDAAFTNRMDAAPDKLAELEQTARGIMTDERTGERDTIKRWIGPIVDSLYDADGNIKTDPKRLYGIRENVREKLEKASRAENPSLGLVERELINIRDALDSAIESGAPGYNKFRTEYARDSREIDALEAMQTAEKSLIVGGKITYAAMQRLMKNVVDARKPDAPVNQWQSLTDDQMERLWNLRDDLRRSASAKERANAPGSDSAQNFFDWAKDYAVSGALRTVGAVPYVGRLVQTARELDAPRAAARAEAARVERMRNMLFRPPPNAMNLQPPP